MGVRESSGRGGGATTWGVVQKVGLVILGVALVGGGLYATIGMARIVLEPTAQVHLECGIFYRGYSTDACPATWEIGHRTVHGTASDPFPDHQYSRFIGHTRTATLTMHVSGNRARMSPHPKSMILFALMFVFGVVIAMYPFLDKIVPQRWKAPST
jgi:hypothetical protein